MQSPSDNTLTTKPDYVLSALTDLADDLEFIFDGQVDINDEGGPNDAMKAMQIVGRIRNLVHYAAPPAAQSLALTGDLAAQLEHLAACCEGTEGVGSGVIAKRLREIIGQPGNRTGLFPQVNYFDAQSIAAEYGLDYNKFCTALRRLSQPGAAGAGLYDTSDKKELL